MEGSGLGVSGVSGGLSHGLGVGGGPSHFTQALAQLTSNLPHADSVSFFSSELRQAKACFKIFVTMPRECLNGTSPAKPCFGITLSNIICENSSPHFYSQCHTKRRLGLAGVSQLQPSILLL